MYCSVVPYAFSAHSWIAWAPDLSSVFRAVRRVCIAVGLYRCREKEGQRKCSVGVCVGAARSSASPCASHTSAPSAAGSHCLTQLVNDGNIFAAYGKRWRELAIDYSERGERKEGKRVMNSCGMRASYEQ